MLDTASLVTAELVAAAASVVEVEASAVLADDAAAVVAATAEEEPTVGSVPTSVPDHSEQSTIVALPTAKPTPESPKRAAEAPESMQRSKFATAPYWFVSVVLD